MSDFDVIIWVFGHLFKLAGAIATGVMGFWMCYMIWEGDRECEKKGFKFDQTLNLGWSVIVIPVLFLFCLFVYSLFH